MGDSDYAHHPLKPATVEVPGLGAVARLNIPEEWRQGLEDGAWCCGRADEEVTLFVRSEVFAMPGSGSKVPVGLA